MTICRSLRLAGQLLFGNSDTARRNSSNHQDGWKMHFRAILPCNPANPIATHQEIPADSLDREAGEAVFFGLKHYSNP